VDKLKQYGLVADYFIGARKNKTDPDFLILMPVKTKAMKPDVVAWFRLNNGTWAYRDEFASLDSAITFLEDKDYTFVNLDIVEEVKLNPRDMMRFTAPSTQRIQ